MHLRAIALLSGLLLSLPAHAASAPKAPQPPRLYGYGYAKNKSLNLARQGAVAHARTALGQQAEGTPFKFTRQGARLSLETSGGAAEVEGSQTAELALSGGGYVAVASVEAPADAVPADAVKKTVTRRLLLPKVEGALQDAALAALKDLSLKRKAATLSGRLWVTDLKVTRAGKRAVNVKASFAFAFE